MKSGKITLLGAMLIFISNSVFAQNLIQFESYGWDSQKSEYKISSMYVASFDTQDSIIETVSQQLNSATSEWYNNYKSEWKRNDDSKVTSNIDYKWSTTNSWNEMRKFEYKYNTEAALLEESRFEYVNGSFEKRETTGYDYNSDDKIESKTLSSLNADNNIIEPRTLTSYKYNGNGDPTEITLQYKYRGKWNNSTRTTFEYNSAGDITLEKNDKYYSNQSNWYINDQIIYDYNSNGELESMEYEKMGNQGVIEKIAGKEYFYSSNGFKTKEISYVWDESLNAWKKSSKQEFVNLPSGHIDSSFTFNWNVSSSTWTNKYMYNFTYEESKRTSVVENNKESREITIFPNPTSSIVSIAFSEALESQLISIFSIDGSLIHEEATSENVLSIDVSDWETGLYLIKTKSGDTKRLSVY